MKYLSIIIILVMLSCHKFDNPLDPTISSPPSLYYKFYRDSVSTGTEMLFIDSLLYVTNPVLIEYGVEHQNDTDVRIDISIFNQEEVLTAYDQFYTGPDSLFKIFEFIADEDDSNSTYHMIFEASDLVGHNRTDSLVFQVDKEIPYLISPTDLGFVHPDQSVSEVQFNEIIYYWTVDQNGIIIINNEYVGDDIAFLPIDFDTYGQQFVVITYNDLVYNTNVDTLHLVFCPEHIIEFIDPDPKQPTNQDTVKIDFRNEILSPAYLNLNSQPIDDYIISNDSLMFYCNFQNNIPNVLEGLIPDIYNQLLDIVYIFNFDSIPPEIIERIYPEITNNYDQTITVIFNEEISAATIMQNDQELSGYTPDGNSLQFNCNFADNNIGLNNIYFSFADSAGNCGEDSLSITYYPAFSLVNIGGIVEDSYIDEDEISINLDFSNKLSFAEIKANGIGELTLQISGTNITSVCKFPQQSIYIFNGQFHDIYKQELNINDTIFYDLKTSADFNPESGALIDSIQNVSVTFNEDISYVSIEYVGADSVEIQSPQYNYPTLNFSIIILNVPSVLTQYDFTLLVKDTDTNNPNPDAQFSFSYIYNPIHRNH